MSQNRSIRTLAVAACAAAVLSLADTASAQSPTGRNLAFSGSTAPGATFNVDINHPTAVAGNIFAMLWSLPYFTLTTPTVPGYTVNGQLGLDPVNFLTGVTGVLAASGLTPTSLTIPNNPGLVGYPLFAQSVDLASATPDIYFSDNRVGVAVGARIGTVSLANPTTSSLTAGNNDLQNVTEGSVGLPGSLGIPRFACLPIRDRGQEGIAEGYGGTFSSTSHNSDVDSLSAKRPGRRTYNGAWQTIVCPNGFDVGIMRDLANPKQFSLLSFNRSTGVSTVIPGSTWVDTGTTAAPAQQNFYMATNRTGTLAAIYLKDSNTTTGFLPKVWVFRTDGSAPVQDVTPAAVTLVTDSFFDGSLCFTNDFLFAFGAQGMFWTSATAPAQMQPVTLPNTAAGNLPNIFGFPLSWRVSPDGSSYYGIISGNATASRGECDIVRITNVAGSPVAVNYSQFATPTGVSEFGFAAISPGTANNTSSGIKASVSPDGTKIAFIPCTTTTTVFNGICVADGTANPTTYTVPGATYYSEVCFLNNSTVLFFAGTGASTTTIAQGFYSLSLPGGTITQIGTAADHRTRGQFWSRNRNFWYFVRSNGASTVNDIVAVNAATGVPQSVTGNEFGTPGSVSTIRTGSFNTTTDPWFALEMQLRTAPVGNFAYFTARKEAGAGIFEDANVFRFDIENGGTATQLTSFAGTGATAGTVKNIESLMISDDGNHLAFSVRTGTASSATAPEDAWHHDIATGITRQVSVTSTLGLGQTITDGSIAFTGGSTPNGIVWSKGTGTATTVPTANVEVEWLPLTGSSTPIRLSSPPTSRILQVIGTN